MKSQIAVIAARMFFPILTNTVATRSKAVKKIDFQLSPNHRNNAGMIPVNKCRN